MKKYIGITVRYHDEANDYWVNPTYLKLIGNFDLEPIFLNPFDRNALNQNLQKCDYLLLTGGPDIDSKYYQEPLHEKAYGIREEIDQLDMDVLQFAETHHIPTFGICRGLQSLNVYFGGSMIQHIENHRELKDNHRVTFTSEDDFFSPLLKKPFILVNSYHHQVCGKVGKNLKVAALSEDKRIEALNHTLLPIIGVQWHPEKLMDEDNIAIFEKFLQLKRK